MIKRSRQQQWYIKANAMQKEVLPKERKINYNCFRVEIINWLEDPQVDSRCRWDFEVRNKKCDHNRRRSIMLHKCLD